ncbi:MAG: 30S ribosomal protein S8 [Patescibacteria group bacterium]
MTDPIADMLTRIRNASRVKKAEVYIPFSKIKLEIIKILKKEGFIADFQEIKPGEEGYKFGGFLITLKYDEEKQPVIGNLKRVSRPGRRMYATKENLPVIMNNYGLAIISTSQGLLTNKQAKKLGLGGEIICQIY